MAKKAKKKKAKKKKAKAERPLTKAQIAERFERGLRNALSAPPVELAVKKRAR
jgi:hypothetical protein